MPSDPSDLADHLGYWLRTVSNAVSHEFARNLAVEGVTPAEWVYLRLVLSGQTSPTALAQAMGMTKGAISKLTDRLAGRGLVERHDGLADRRAQGLRLTVAGRAMLPALAAIADQNDAAFFDTLTEAERATLRALMQKMAARHGLHAPPVD